MAGLNVCKVVGSERVRPKINVPSKLVGNFSEAEPTLTLKEAAAEASTRGLRFPLG